MKKIERKELIELLNDFIKKDCKEDLLQLIENEIVDKKMCQSKHWEVRHDLAINGYFIDILIDDKDANILFVAYDWLIQNKELKQKHINYAIKQDNRDVLYSFIKNKIVDERMCNSRHWKVRAELAKNGYFIEILINDSFKYVRYKVYQWLIENNKLEQKHIDYAIQLDDENILLLLIHNKKINEKMCQSNHCLIREELADKGYFINELINDSDGSVLYKVYEWLIQNNKLEQKHIDLAIQQDNNKILLLLIENGIIDKRMWQSKHSEVREELAEKGYFINILIVDQNIDVKYQVYQWLIKNNKLEQHHIDLVVEEDNTTILLLLIEEAIINKEMCQSKDWVVRQNLVEKGYFVDILIEDECIFVRNEAYKCLIKNNKLKQKHINQLFFNKDYEVLQFLVNSNYKNKLINKEQFLKKIKEFQEEKKNNLSLLVHNKSILKNNS